MPTYSTPSIQQAYDALLQQSRRRAITKEQFRHKKAVIDRREARIQARVEAREEAKYERAEARIKKTELNNKYINNIKKLIKEKKAIRIDLTWVDKNIGLHKFFQKLIKINKKMTVRIGDTFYVISDFTREKLLDIIKNDYTTVEELHEDSNGAFWETVTTIKGDMILEEFNPTNKNRLQNGAFFKYTHKTSFDLANYGIYKTGEHQIHSDTCLIDALRAGGLEEPKIEEIKLTVKNRLIPQSKLREICERANIEITLKKDDKKCSKIVYGKSDKKFHIGLLDDHYFLVEKTEITRYSLEHYDEVKDVKDFNKIYKIQANGSYNRSNDRFLDSFDVIKILLENKKTLLKEISIDDRIVASTQFYDSISQTISSLEFDPDVCCKSIEKKSSEEKIKYTNIVFDFETNPNGVHKPYLVRTYGEGVNDVFIGDDCGLQMLRSLKGNTRLIAHNATYDYRFLIEHLCQIEELARGNRLISLSAKFYVKEGKHIKVQIKDSYHLISMPLAEFPEVFGLDSMKEVMPYKLYTQENIEKRFCNINEVLETIADENKTQFLQNIERWNLRKGDDYDIIEYSSRYCELDCIILWNGYNKFRDWQKSCVDIDIDKVLTIASLAHQYFVNEGCYEGVNQLGGIPQAFIQGCVVGGRTMTAENKKIKLLTDDLQDDFINDFDAVSLYPSAMARMPGFLKGVPKVITNLDYNDLKTKDGYFVDIIIKTVGIKRDFPLISAKNDDGIRIFSNDMINKTIRVDKTTLEDLIEFQNVEFEVIRGYYFNEGFNTKVKETVEFLFNERLTKKKEKNPIEIVYKLIMNSSYGKSIMKPVDNETKFFDHEDEFGVYLSRHYNWATSYTKFGTKTKLKMVKTLIDHFNICQVGVSILSMSKRIMNEVMCLAEDKGIKLYYQDTDSIHIKDKDINTLSNSFFDKYNRVLIGKGMGQFHSDFDIKYTSDGKKLKCENVKARRSIFLGKKSYIDELVGTNHLGEEVVDYHIRMKGIPNSCLLHTSNKLGYNNIFDMYVDLYKGKAIEVDLTNDGKKANFKFNPDYSCHTLSIFKRTLHFTDKETKKQLKKASKSLLVKRA